MRIRNQGDQEGETAVQLELLLLQILVRAVFEEVGEASGFRAVPSFPGCDRPVEASLNNCCTREKGNVIAVQRGEMCSQVVNLRLCRLFISHDNIICTLAELCDKSDKIEVNTW